MKGAAPRSAASVEGRKDGHGVAARGERLGIVSYTNVAPLHWRMEGWEGVTFVHGVPTELNARLLDGDIDLTLVSSVEFVRHRDVLRALPDFSIATVGPVQSVMLFHRVPWSDLTGKSVAVTTDSATSVALLEVLLRADGIDTRFVPHAPDLDEMLQHHDAALLIGDVALEEAVAARAVGGAALHRTDLGEAWYRLTNLPFTFAVWAAHVDRPPSPRLVAELRAARSRGLGHLAAVAAEAAEARRLSPEVILRYLANFRYFLDAADRRGLEAFAARVDPSFSPDELRYWPA